MEPDQIEKSLAVNERGSEPDFVRYFAQVIGFAMRRSLSPTAWSAVTDLQRAVLPGNAYGARFGARGFSPDQPGHKEFQTCTVNEDSFDGISPFTGTLDHELVSDRG